MRLFPTGHKKLSSYTAQVFLITTDSSLHKIMWTRVNTITSKQIMIALLIDNGEYFLLEELEFSLEMSRIFGSSIT